MMKTVARRQKKVLIVLNMAGTAGRRHLEGILRYVNTVSHWDIQIVGRSDDFTQEVLDKAIREHVDGIYCVSDRNTSKVVSRCRIPFAVIDYSFPIANIRTKAAAIVIDDDEAIGANAAKYLHDLGSFGAYAFVPAPRNPRWSRQRERGYRLSLARHGIHPDVYAPRKESLESWLARLPKPAAVFAAYDFGALDVLNACRRMRLPVPGQVAVLGVDDDEIICENSDPPLSSVSIDHVQNAYDLAKRLDRLMNSRKLPRRAIMMVRPGEIRERESTRHLENSAHIVRKAMHYIAAKAADSITVTDVISHLGVSKTVAYDIFSKYSGKTFRQAIEDAKMEKLTDLLRSSNLPIAKACALAGFRNHQRAKYVFKSRFGISMRDYRKQQIGQGCVSVSSNSSAYNLNCT